MYIATQHVKGVGGGEGVNCFLYLHRGVGWEVPPTEVPAEDPGELVQSAVHIPPGNNPVRSYLDVVAPDGTDWEEIDACFVTFLSLAMEQSFPWEAIVRRCKYCFGIERGLAQQWRQEIARLYGEAKRVYAANQPNR